MANNAIAINQKKGEAPKQWRLQYLSGDRKGQIIVLSKKRTIVGRGDKAEIKINDSKSSREHAEFFLSGEELFLTDLDSQNGIVVNDRKVKQQKLKEDDRLIIGQTTFRVLDKNTNGVQELNKNILDLKKKLNSSGQTWNEDSDQEIDFTKEKSSTKKKPNLIVIIVVVLVGILFFMPEDKINTSQRVGKLKSGDITEDLTVAKKNKNNDKENEERVAALLHRGQREYREGNFFRAMEEYRQAKTLMPGDAKSEFYFDKAKKALDNDIKERFIKSTREVEALRYNSALKTLCSITKVLSDYTEDERYKAAKANIKTVEAKLGLEPGETKCDKE